jgi:C4-dicarboxylate-specific signal transduction histidine kinase
VLLLYSLAADAPAAPPFIDHLRAAMRSEMSSPVELYVEYLDLDRFPDPRQAVRLTNYLGAKYGDFQVDVIVAAGSVALHFTTDHLREQLPNVPIVFGMAYAHDVDTAALPSYVTGRVLSVSLGQTIAMIRQLQPGVERLYLIAGSSSIDSLAMDDALGSIGPMRDSIEVVVRRGVPFDQLIDELRTLPPHSAVFFAHFRRDGRGQLFVPQEAMGILARAARAPSYGYVDRMLGYDILGGAMFLHDAEGTNIGRMAARVVRSPPGAPLPRLEAVASPYVADWRVLRRFGLDERRLPPGTDLRYREPSIWERNRDAILIALGIMFAQALLIGTLLLERRARRRAQLALREQSVYERTIAELTSDALRHAPEDAPRALEDALARVATYADADAAALVQYADGTSRAGSRLEWAREPDPSATVGEEWRIEHDAIRLDMPLVVAGTEVGVLELYRTRPGNDWPGQLSSRLVAPAEVIAGAIARARALAAADEAHRQVAHLGRVAIVGELGSTISHELRQPLTAIRVNAEVGARMLSAAHPDLKEAKSALEDVAADAARASEIIESIRLMLRKRGPETIEVDLNEVSEHVVALLRRAASSHGATIALELQADLPRVKGNPVELRQVVLNMALNALDAVSSVDGERRVVIATSCTERLVELCVRDTGPGFTVGVRQRLFDPFYTTKGDGLGMGLSIVRTLVEQHGGRVTAESGGKGGAVFRMLLPVASVAAGELPSGDAALRPATYGPMPNSAAVTDARIAPLGEC